MLFRIIFICAILTCLVSAPVSAEQKPVIGITMSYTVSESGLGSVRLTIPTVDAVTEVGGVPVLLPPIKSEEDVERFFDIVDGFIFTGGSDINPATYGQEKHETTNILPERREEFDLMLMKKVLDSDKPVLGICLGMQEMNVACKGTLIQDIPSQTNSTLIHKGKDSGHEVEIVDGTMTRDLLGGLTFAVNSMHHQAVDELGEGLTITAKSPDGIIEGIEKSDHPYAVGVQWHPEYLTEDESQMNLFRGLIKAAKEGMESSEAETVMAE